MNTQRIFLAATLLLLAILACNIPETTTTPAADSTALAETVAALQTTVAAPTDTPTPTYTPFPTLPAGAQRPTVVTDTLCWLGPGDAYEVSSAVRAGQQVDLVGRDLNHLWWIIIGPIYHDPCWVMRDTLRLDPSFDTSILPIIAPPPTPTPTPTLTPTKTATPTPTLTPTP